MKNDWSPDGGGRRPACTKNPALQIRRREQRVIRIARYQLRQQTGTSLRLAKSDGVHLGDRQQQLSSAFTQLAYICGKLPNSIDNAFANRNLPLAPQVEFEAGLACHQWENGEAGKER